MKNFRAYLIVLFVLMICLPIVFVSQPAMAGVVDFFLRLLVGVGKWVSTTVLGGLIENSVDYLFSFLNPETVKPDYWGALTGTSYPRSMEVDVAGVKNFCYSPNPTHMYRESFNSGWRISSDDKELLIMCIRALKS
jgi:hypothetical protein